MNGNSQVNTIKQLYFVGYIFHESMAKIKFAKSTFAKTVYRGRGRTGGIALMPQLSVLTSSNTWNPSTWIRTDLRWRKKAFHCEETSISTLSRINMVLLFYPVLW